MAKALQANALVTTIIVAGVTAGALFGTTYELKSATTIVYAPNVPALDGLLDGQEYFGASVAAIGDHDGNGVTELVVGATRDNDDGRYTGAAWILFLGPTGSLQSAAKISPTHGGLAPGVFVDYSGFGSPVAGLGDVDANGIPDIAVGGATARGALRSQGALWLLHANDDGSARSPTRIVGGEPEPGGEICLPPTTTTSLSTTTTTTTTTTLPDLDALSLPLRLQDYFGAAVSVTRDFDANLPRIAVGAPASDDVECDSGAVWIIDIDANGTPIERSRVTLEDATGGALSGSAVAWLGDLDHDGNVELAIGAPANGSLFSCGPNVVGEITIASIAQSGAVVATRRIDSSSLGGSPAAGLVFGGSLAAVGDIDGDGVTELAVGVRAEPSPTPPAYLCESAVWILFLASDGAVKSAKEISPADPIMADAIGDATDAAFSFGHSLAGGGDLNGDGVPDLAIGAPWFTLGPGEARGAIFVVSLDATGGIVHARRVTDESPNATTTSLDCRFGCHASTSTTFSKPSTTLYPPICGDAYDDGQIDSTDALWALFAAVGLRHCTNCDVDCTQTNTARDALMILQAAIGSTSLTCACS